MNLSEILRALADKIDSIEQPSADHDHNTSPNQAALVPVEVDNVDHAESEVMIAPLQQKLELLKKAAGVESVYDEACDACGQTPCGCNDANNEMEIMKRNAGVPTVAIQLAGEDEPFEG
jgi:hypothetical protein